MTTQWWCPVCAAPCPWPPAGSCERCGAPLDSPLIGDVIDTDRRLAALQERRLRLVAALRAAAGTPAPPATSTPLAADAPGPASPAAVRVAPPLPAAASPPAARRAPAASPTQTAPRRRLRGASAQTLLAASGAALLALAGIVFVAVTWAHLPALAQAALLAAATAVAGIAARALRRRALTSTAEAVGAVAAALAIVTVHGGRAQGAAGLDAVPFDVYAAATGALLAMAFVVWSRWAGVRTGQVAAVGVAALAVVTAPAALSAHTALPAEAYPLGLTVALALAAAFRRVLGARSALLLANVLVGVGAGAAWVGALGSALLAAQPAQAGWALAAAATLAAWLWTRPGRPAAAAAAGAASTVAAAVVAAPALGLAGPVPELVAAGLVGLVAALAVVALPARRDAAAVGAAAVPGVVAVCGGLWLVAEVVADAVRLRDGVWLQPEASAHPDWWVPLTGVALAAGAGVLLAWRRDGRPADHPRVGVVAVSGAVGLAVGGAAVTGGGWWAQALLGVALLAGAAAATVRADLAVPGREVAAATWPESVAVLAGVWLLAWSLGHRWATVAALVVVAGTGLLVVTVAHRRCGSERTPWALGGVGALLALPMTALGAAGAAPATVAVAGGASVAVAGVVAGAWRRQPALPALPVGAEILTGPLAAVATMLAPSRTALAAVAYLAAVGATGNGLISARLWPVHVGAAVASAGTALLLSAHEVGVIEAYAAVPAAATLGLGLWRLRRDPRVGSVAALRVPLALGLGPTAVQVLADPSDLPRVVALVAAAVVLAALGARLRWSALVLAAGACVTVVVATQGWLVAAALPRWVVFAVGGLALVALSATWERQLQRLAALRRHAVLLR